MIFLVTLAIAFALSFATEWMTGRGAVATLVPVVCFAAVILLSSGAAWSSDDTLLVLMIVVTLGAFGGGWGVFSARALKRRRNTQDVL